ncbi:sulfate adenylyltransferase subunit CysD [Geomonas sp.]|uniref:sulfate adenylyltransferase subunit CysD n=1 Tax=Geomonas sp. TaxID=2651584 RepID=UPI002B4598CD|nr:sulfate adenylyltransferase subunit CysD [Geomonas sp.]HJV34483.1 sulfate adenylyltransferase subunit CysD [Geomonas sp.]
MGNLIKKLSSHFHNFRVYFEPQSPGKAGAPTVMDCLNALSQLEQESIHILREAVAEAERPAMLYSIGKDSSVMLHLALKAFYPLKPPFPLVHVDTTWKFREMISFRDQTARRLGLELVVHTNPDGVRDKVTPFTHGSRLYTDIMKTDALKQVLNRHRFDMVFGGARRDEEKSRAKERVFSFRDAHHRWEPRGQRPELWNIPNLHRKKGESFRVFPLSNWTELDVWRYIEREKIPVVPLYFAAKRPMVERDGQLIMVDDQRFPLLPGEKPELRQVRFRTLGCYPLTAGVDSSAATVGGIVKELEQARSSERCGRLIDFDQAGSMEKKKQEGYF